MQSRVEQYIPEQPFDGVLSRAFSSLEDMVNWCKHLVEVETGRFFALKGQFPKDEIAAMPSKIVVVESVSLKVPELDGDRHLIELKKIN